MAVVASGPGGHGPRIGGWEHFNSTMKPKTPSLFAPPQPLAARMRPRELAEFVGQAHLVGPGRFCGGP